MTKLLRMLALLGAVTTLYGCAAVIVGGAGTAVLMGEDRRTVGTVTEDQGIELKAAARIREKFSDVHYNMTSFNRMVLITGEAPDLAAKNEIERLVRSVENVRGAYNEMLVAGNTSLSARANDSYLTGKVKARFIDQKKFNVVHIKVITEANAVYLMGLVSHKEADDAVEIARTTAGVQKVVKLFEYID